MENNNEWIAKYINLIGKSGSNGIYNFIIDQNPNYHIVFETEIGAGANYHFYDYKLDIISKLGQKLSIMTKALMDDDNNFITRIQITELSKNTEKEVIEKNINGWNHNKLINFTSNDLIKNNSDNKNINNNSFTNEQFKEIYDILNLKLIQLIANKDYNERLLNEVLYSLTEDQIHVLKKRLNSGNYKKI